MELYENGLLKNTVYFNAKEQEIAKQEFQINNNVKGPCGDVIGNYFITGNRKLKKKEAN